MRFTPAVLAELAAWNRANRRARHAYYAQPVITGRVAATPKRPCIGCRRLTVAANQICERCKNQEKP